MMEITIDYAIPTDQLCRMLLAAAQAEAARQHRHLIVVLQSIGEVMMGPGSSPQSRTLWPQFQRFLRERLELERL